MKKTAILACGTVFFLLAAVASFAGNADAAQRLGELEGTWLFDADATAKQLQSSSNNELEQNKFKHRLELSHGNTCLEIRALDASTLRITSRNLYDEATDKNTFAMHVDYNRGRDYYIDEEIGLIAIREGVLAFQSIHSELSLLYRKME